MPRKKDVEQTIIEKIYDYSLEEIMETSFSRYSKEIIQERALPDVRDGLKPVQRRILYAMYISHFTHDKPYRKSAKAVGDIMGNFHPHGDSSIYDAMIRMSQPWKMRETFIDVHGNNGSIDGDPPAASRYTEARLSKIAEVMLNSINKDTVEMTYNFDDTELEPTVLPAAFPNLLVNGSTGISAGYATNIPPHNLSEVIDATIKRIDSPNCKLETVMEYLKGPDFPTGGVIEGKAGLIDAYTKGKGKVVLKAKIEVVTSGSKKEIIIHSIPYEVVKEQLIRKLNEIRIDKKVEGINEIIDESDYEHMARIKLELKANANTELIINYLLKNTELQINYNFNMVAIVNRRPRLVGILEVLDAFIAHQKEVITRRTRFDLNHAKASLHILEGLKKAISILDEVIHIIRASKNKSDAIENLIKEYSFTFEQSKAIVELQLYRLTNTDIVSLEEEMAKLEKNINIWTQILNNEEALKHVMKTELKIVKKEYGNERRTEIKDEITEIKVDMNMMIPNEQVIVVVTNEGYVKKVSLKSYKTSTEETTLKPGDYIVGKYAVSTLDTLLLFTNLGNYLYIPVHKLADCKWKDLGKHISNTIMIKEEERIISNMILKEKQKNIVLFTKNGAVKQIPLASLEVSRYSKPLTAIKLKDNDELINVEIAKDEVVFVSANGYYLRYNTSEIPVVGPKASGVKAMSLKEDELVFASSIMKTDEYLNIFTNFKTAKRLRLNDLVSISRAKKGNMLFKKVKTKDYKIICAYLSNSKDINILKYDVDFKEIKNSEIPIMDLASTGSVIVKNMPDSYHLLQDLIEFDETKKEELPIEKTNEPSKKEQLSFSEFIEDFKI